MPRNAMISDRINEAMNAQLREELASAYQYLAMSAYLEQVPLPGAAHWMRLQAQEEVEHAMRFYRFVNDRNGRVHLYGLPEPRRDFKSVADVFEQALEHEQKVTAEIMKLYEIAVAEKDYVSQPFLQEFLTEQIEEEKSAGEIVDTLRLTGDVGPALFMMDRELAKRQKAE